MIRAGVVGAAGYTGGELLRILLLHPEVSLAFAQSSSHAGEPLWKAHADLFGSSEIHFCAEADHSAADVIFLCSGHGKSRSYVQEYLLDYKGVIIDLSQDYRLTETAEGFVYGLPEAFRDDIVGARRIAGPGCFASAMQFAILPAAKAGILGRVSLFGITGSTGAGQKPSETTHFSWRFGNMSVYKPFTHQHLLEVRQNVQRLFPEFSQNIDFVPVRGDFARGILMSASFDTDLSEEDLKAVYDDFFRGGPFVRTVDFNPDMKMVLGTNNALVYVRKWGGVAHVVCVLDNLIKGASGVAVQNMNIAFGLDETAGLRLKAQRF